MKVDKATIPSEKATGIADYFRLYRNIVQNDMDAPPDHADTVKIAILSSFTVKGVKETLFVKCCELGIHPDIYVADYNQYSQEILNPDGGLYEFSPDLIIVFIDTVTILAQQHLLPYCFSDKQREDWVGETLRELEMLIRQIKMNSSAKILFHNFEVPLYSPLGIHESKQEFGMVEAVQALNTQLRSAYKADSQVFCFDYDSFCAKIGKQNVLDYKMYYLGDMKLNPKCIPRLCDDYLAYIKPYSAVRKCIVLDLDNTLWGGIVGEDGMEGIRLGPTPEGRPFVEFQKYLLSLFERGVILAINSRNNSDEALRIFREHPYMILKEEHIAAWQINWNDKVSNMKAIAEEINIGLDSLVFIDDDIFNREMVKEALPEILVVDLPEDHAGYLKTLMEVNDFNTFQFTREDKKRGKIYAQERQRRQHKRNAGGITEYLKSLEIIVTVERPNSFNIPRIAQLTQRTNQFNLTTRRYLEENIRQFAEDNSYICNAISAKDKFGDNGLVGVVVILKKQETWVLDSFLLSCRVLGRDIEKAILAYVLREAKEAGAKKILAEYIPTSKNAPASKFYEQNGFAVVRESCNGGGRLYEYDLCHANCDITCMVPDYVKMLTG
jgi:FkbH-like protein